jgi:pilus assembly protein CpaB
MAVVLVYGYLERSLDAERQRYEKLLETELNKAHKSAPQVQVVVETELRSVLVIQRDVFRGERLGPKDLKVLKVPVEGVMVKGVLTNPSQALGRIALQTIYAGEWVVVRKLSAEGEKNTEVTAVLEDGRKAISVAVNAESGLLGLIEPDDRVDVIGVFDVGSGKKQKRISRMLIQNIRVIAVGGEQVGVPSIPEVPEGNSEDNEDTFSMGMGSAQRHIDDAEFTPVGMGTTVTLDVGREEAEKLALLTDIGKVHLALRNKSDFHVEESIGVDASSLRSAKRSQKKRAYKPRKRQVIEILQGESVEKEIFK